MVKEHGKPRKGAITAKTHFVTLFQDGCHKSGAPRFPIDLGMTLLFRIYKLALLQGAHLNV